jgi:hypothetical protein
MRLFYDKWRIPIDDSFQENEEHGAHVFRQDRKAVYVRLYNHGLSKADGIQYVKAHANPRHIVVFEEDRSLIYRWAIKWAEEIEAPFPGQYLIEAHYVIEGEALVVVTEHQGFKDERWAHVPEDERWELHLEDQRWANHLVRSVEFDREWNLTASAYVYALYDRYVFGSYSRIEDGEWFGNRFLGSLPADAAVADLGKLVRQALGRTRRGVLTRNRSRHARSPSDSAAFLRAAGVSSDMQLYVWAHMMYLQAKDTVITMIPCCNYTGYDRQFGHWALESSGVQIAPACSNEELGQALRTAKGLCTRWDEYTDASK